MKLHQNAKELALVEVDGLGFILGEIRYNRQTETVIFALEKAAFFDLYFPCAVLYDQQRGPIVHPHVLTALTTSSIRIQRSHVSCFILETDLNPRLIQQYRGLLDALLAKQATLSPQKNPGHQGPERPKPTGGSRVINLRDHKEKD